jgi:predicted DNA-binding protein with PD1-like motif
MKSKLLSNGGNGERSFAIVFDTGDEITTELLNFAREKNVSSAHFAAIGACERVTIAFYNLEKKEYEENPVDEQVEVMSLVGNITIYENEPKLHAHISVGKRDGTAHGGHLIEGVVRPTLELFLTETPALLQRADDEESGLPLIDLNERYI